MVDLLTYKKKLSNHTLQPKPGHLADSQNDKGQLYRSEEDLNNRSPSNPLVKSVTTIL